MLQLWKFSGYPTLLSPLFLPSLPLSAARVGSLRPVFQRPIILIQAAKSSATATTTAAAEAVDASNNSDTFFANEGVSWGSLGVSEKLSQSLCNAGFLRPSLIQVLPPVVCEFCSVNLLSFQCLVLFLYWAWMIFGELMPNNRCLDEDNMVPINHLAPLWPPAFLTWEH